jgi:putative endonuclease
VSEQHPIVTIRRRRCAQMTRREVVTDPARFRCERVLSRHATRRRLPAMAIDLRHHLGRVGERLALEHLERLGYRLVTRNYRTRFGEIDLIVCDETTIVFVEVKARRADAVAGALEAVSPRKQRQVRSMAAAWLVEASDRPRARDLRFDVVGVTVDRHGTLVRLDHLEEAF